MKIKITALDRLFSKVVRLRAKGYCEIGKEWRGYNKLQTCHCWGRRKKSVRWDLDNACAGCFFHHQQIDENAEDKIAFFKKYLGEKRYEKLGQRANWRTLKKVDEKLIEIFLTQELKKLENKNDGRTEIPISQ